MATFQIASPDSFDFQQPEEWPKWIRRFERFRQASGLAEKESCVQVNALIYAMGDEGDDILASFGLTTAQKANYKVVLDKFDGHFVTRRNVIYERAKFNSRIQREDEPVDKFITALYGLIEHCDYGTLTDDMIRDRIVVGLRNDKLSEKLQLDPDLTLPKAIQQARQCEQVKKQQPTLRSHFQAAETKEADVGAVHKKGANFHFQQKGRWNPGSGQQKTFPSKSDAQSGACRWCGKSPSHKRSDCPAKNSSCQKCSKHGHWAAVCLSTSTIAEVAESEPEFAFLDKVSVEGSVSNAFIAKLPLNNTMVNFKIDTGADVSIIPASLYSVREHGPIKMSNKLLTHAGGTRLECTGRFTGKINYNGKMIDEEIYILPGAKHALLGKPAIQAFDLVSTLNIVYSEASTPQQRHPKLFTGLGKVPGEYEVELKPDAEPFAVATPRRIAIPLLPTVKEELRRMEEMGVISKVEKPTSWCAPIVVVPKRAPKPDDQNKAPQDDVGLQQSVRICVDLTKLNESIRRPRHTLPSIEQTLGQLAGAKVFTKLDANSGFWQIQLSQKSAELTTFITPFGRYCFNRLPFGITSAPEYYQKKMQEILDGLDGVGCIMDDMVVYGETQEIHDRRLEAVFQRIGSHPTA